VIDLKWDNPNDLLRKVREMLDAQARKIGAIPANAVRRATFELQAKVQGLVPKVTSTLVRSITAKIDKGADGTVTGRIGTHLKYGPYVEFGTGVFGPNKQAIVITAKNKRGLFWGAYDKDGKPIIRRSVTIQGMKPRAPFGKATTQFLPRYLEIINQELAKAAK
jgi:hypothetical protein